MKLSLPYWGLIIFLGFSQALEETDENLNDFIGMSLQEIVHHYNYTFKEYTVLTKDGYILTMLRLQNLTVFNPDAMPIMLLHGLSGCANNWFLKGKVSLPFVLANMGYDIWMANTRGTYYSRQHVSLNFRDPEFWKFSWHEMGVYDIPASIDVALNETGHEKLAVIAHSEGSCYFFVMAAELPEYDAKVYISIHMTPGVFFRNPRIQSWRPLAKHYNKVGVSFVKFLHLHALTFPSFNKVLTMICQDKVLSVICRETIWTVFEDKEELEEEMFPFLSSLVPCGGSTGEGLHYAQNMDSGDFNHYDYGPKKNLRLYNSTKPPPYNLSNVKSKVIIMGGSDDWLSSVSDIKLLASKLPNVVHTEMPYKTHMDYLIGKHAYKYVYSKIAKYLKRFNNIEAKRKRLVN